MESLFNASTISIDWFDLGIAFAGGLALFLYGMSLLVNGLTTYSGDKMRHFLETLVRNRISGALTGAGVTAVIQSSSATTVLVVGFISAGMLSLTQGVSIIMGANLGTTVTAQIIAFKITHYALLILAMGVVVSFLAQSLKQRALGNVIIGLGLIFFGMQVMSDAMSPLRDYPPFLAMMAQMQSPLFGILIGLVFTALVQSSSATVGIVIVLASNGFLTLPAGIALILGANVGTCVTALLAAIGKSRDALRAAVAHVSFNVLAVLVWLPFLPYLADLAVWLSANPIEDATQQVLGSAVLAEQTPREIANANTVFNLSALLLFLPLLSGFVWFAYRLVPISEEEKQRLNYLPQFLDDTQLATPSLALQAVELELARVGHLMNHHYIHVVDAVMNQRPKEMDKLVRDAHHILQVNTAVLLYLGKLKNQPMDDIHNAQLLKLISQLDQFESMIDVILNDILVAGQEMFNHEIKPSAEMLTLISDFSHEVAIVMRHSFMACCEHNHDLIVQVVDAKENIDYYVDKALAHQVQRLDATPERIQVLRVEMQLVDAFKHMYTLSKRAARIEARYLSTQAALSVQEG
ncbi:MAG: Na/Pi cotransporter family protein [Gammaproteobacteria bacterium]|nr:Na/Pi cotransporter family protein [Gammaproteobacteria bacterium]